MMQEMHARFNSSFPRVLARVIHAASLAVGFQTKAYRTKKFFVLKGKLKMHFPPGHLRRESNDKASLYQFKNSAFHRITRY